MFGTSPLPLKKCQWLIRLDTLKPVNVFVRDDQKLHSSLSLTNFERVVQAECDSVTRNNQRRERYQTYKSLPTLNGSQSN